MFDLHSRWLLLSTFTFMSIYRFSPLTFAGFFFSTTSVTNHKHWSCICDQQTGPRGTSGPWTQLAKSEIVHGCTAGDSTAPAPPHRVGSVPVRRHAGSRAHRADDYSQRHKARVARLTPLLLLRSCRNRAHTPIPLVNKMSLRPPPPSLLLRRVLLLPLHPTGIPAFLCMSPLPGVFVLILSISISDVGIRGVPACRGGGGDITVPRWEVDGGCQEAELLLANTVVCVCRVGIYEEPVWTWHS